MSLVKTREPTNFHDDLITSLQQSSDQLRAELTALRAWKESAMEADALWEAMRAFAMRKGARLGRSLAVECIRIVGEMEAELAALRAKMDGMVCGTCRGLEEVCSMDSDGDPDAEPDGPLIPCPVCQPAKEVKP